MVRPHSTLPALLLSFAALLFHASAGAQTVLSQQNIGGAPRVVAVNPVNNKVYIAQHGINNVHIIDVATGVPHDVPLGFGPPTSLAVDPISGRVMVGGEGTTAAIDPDTDALVLIPVGNGLFFTGQSNLTQPSVIFPGSVAATIAAVVMNPPAREPFYTDPANNFAYPGDINSGVNPGQNPVPCPGPMAVNPITSTIYIAETCNAALAQTHDGFTYSTVTTPIDLNATHVNPTAVAVNPVTGVVYVALEGTNGVQIIDGVSDPVLATGFSNPVAIAVNPTTNKVYVANDNNVVEINGFAVTPIAVGFNPGPRPVAISVDNVRNRIYVANKVDGSISVINGDTRAVTNLNLNLGSGAAPNSIAVNPLTSRAYVVDETNGLLTVVDGAAFTSAAQNDASLTGAADVVVDPLHFRTFFANGTHVVVVASGDDVVEANFDLGATVIRMAVDPISGQLFAATSDGTVGPQSVAVIGTDNLGNPVVTTTRTINSTPLAMAVNPATQTVYVTSNFGNVQAIDAKALTVSPIRTTGPTPIDIAVDAANNRFYVADTAPGGNFEFHPTGFPSTLNGSEIPATSTSRVVANPATGRAYFVHAAVVDEFDGNSATPSVIAHYPFASPPTDIALNSITNHVYVTDGTTSLHVLDPVSGTELAPIALTGTGSHVSIDELADRIYVSTPGSILTIDGETGKIVATTSATSPGKAATDAAAGETWVPTPGQPLVLKRSDNTEGNYLFGDGTAIQVPGANGFVTSLASPVFSSPPPDALYSPNAPGGILARSGVDDLYGPNALGSFDGTNYSFNVPASLATGLHYLTVFATDNMSGTVTNSQTGTLGANGGLSYLMGEATVQPFVVVDPPSIPGNTVFLDGTEGIPYSSNAIAANGGTGNNSFAVTGGALPDGPLSLDPATAAITGTPTLAGTYPFTVTVTDDSGGSSSTPLSIHIALGAPLVGVAPTAQVMPDTTVGQTSIPETIQIFNPGWGAPSVTGASMMGANAGDFTIASSTCTTALVHALNCTIQVKFSPTATGSRGADIRIALAGAQVLFVDVPVVGTGLASTATLTAAANGTGTGTITSSPAGINCPGDCSEPYNLGTVVTLTATPGAGSAFSQWTNCPSASSNQCTVTIGADTTVTATFTALTTYNIVLEGFQEVAPYVDTAGTGGGTAVFDSFTGQLTFNISYSSLTNNETDTHIYDAPRGTNGPAIIPMSGTPTKTDAIHLSPSQQVELAAGRLYVNIASAQFPSGEIRGQIDNLGAAPVQVITASKAGTGDGTILGISEAGGIIVCGLVCNRNVPTGKSVSFFVTPASGSIFAGWGGACSGTGACDVTMDAAKTVTATFNLAAGPTLTLTADKTTVAFGGGVKLTFTASGASGTPTGTVVLMDGHQPLFQQLVDPTGQAIFSLLAPALGTHSFSVQYQGDGTYAAGTSPTVTVTVLGGTDIPRLGAISTRMQVLTGDNVLIGGFVISGSTPKTVVVRARGPSLAAAGITNFLANPLLQLVFGDGTVLTNDDWQSAANAADVQASGFAPSNPNESAILVTLQPGAYTAIVSGVGGGTGVGIVEVFEVDHPEIPMAGISTRGFVSTGDSVMIGGIIIQGAAPQTVVVRARGPSLAAQGVANPLSNPLLQLVASDGTVLTNDDWQSAANAADVQASGFAPSDPRESAILVTLQPGAYTAIVSGVGGATGVGIVEAFTVP